MNIDFDKLSVDIEGFLKEYKIKPKGNPYRMSFEAEDFLHPDNGFELKYLEEENLINPYRGQHIVTLRLSEDEKIDFLIHPYNAPGPSGMVQSKTTSYGDINSLFDLESVERFHLEEIEDFIIKGFKKAFNVK